jgi:hypothetical protein
MTPPRINARRDARIVVAYREGRSIPALAATHGVGEKRVRQILSAAGVALRPPAKPPTAGRVPVPVVAPDGRTIGGSLAEAAAALGVSYQAVLLAGERRDGVLYLTRLPGRRRA